MPTGGLISLNGKNHSDLKKKLFARRWCGITNRKGYTYDVEEMGWNYYMNEFSAAIGISQLKKLDKMNLIRKKIAKRYENEINLENKIPFNDVYCGMKILRKDFFKKINFFSTGMVFCLEILIKSKINEAKMGEIPITLFKDGRKLAKSHLKTVPSLARPNP